MTKEEEESMEKLRTERHRQRLRHGAFYNTSSKQKKVGVDPDEDIPQPPKSSSGQSTLISTDFYRGADLIDDQVKTKITTKSKRFLVGFADTIGRRVGMEDDMIIVGQFRGKIKEDFFAIFDGHNGSAVANFVAKNLGQVLADIMDKSNDPVECLKQAFKDTNNLVKKKKVDGGCTALAVLFMGDKGYVANAGDCRAVLCKENKAIRLTKDHKPDDKEEEQRIKQLGGEITSFINREGKITSRVNGILSTSRAFGDFEMAPFITSDPDVQVFNYMDGCRFLILACDGLWDVLSDQEAVDIAMPYVKPGYYDCEQASKRLRDVAYARGSTDNISLMIIRPLTPAEIKAGLKNGRNGFTVCSLL